MKPVLVQGTGVVSPAGWGMDLFRAALAEGKPIEARPLLRPGWTRPLMHRPVPPPPTRPGFLSHPRLRRAGTLTHHVVAAALEAIGSDVKRISQGEIKLGIVVCLLAGSVNYSRRFFEETMKDPAVASPMLFPETVFNAPASHLAAYLNSPQITQTVIGDEGCFLQGLAMAGSWLVEGQVDSAIVIGGEEMDWIVADALELFESRIVSGGGAGALYLTASPQAPLVARLECVTDSFVFTIRHRPAKAAHRMRRQLPAGNDAELLVSGALGLESVDRAENEAWFDWPGHRLTPRATLGQAFTASAAWQCVQACESLRNGDYTAANVSVVGTSQQAIGARFARAAPSPTK